MAGDWIPWVKGLTKKREVIAIASKVRQDRRWVASVMMELWEWADSESTDGFIPAVSEAATLTALIPDTSTAFWLAVEAVGWLTFRNGGLEIPNFTRWLGNSAKRRLQECEKKRKQRLSPILSPPDGDKSGDKKRDTCSVLSSSLLSSSGVGGLGEGGEPAAALAAEWCFLLTRIKGGYPADANADMLREFGELLRLGRTVEALQAALRDPARDRGEYFWQFKARLEKPKAKDMGQRVLETLTRNRKEGK